MLLRVLFDLFSFQNVCLFGLTVTTMACGALFLLSSIVPWPKRKRSDFIAPTKTYAGKDEGVSLNNLLREDPREKPLYTESSLYLSVVIPSMNEEERLPKMLDECLDYLLKRKKDEEEFSFEPLNEAVEVEISYLRVTNSLKSDKYPAPYLRVTNSLRSDKYPAPVKR
ncbi:unnamed protein product [Cylicostephanus goldi]|uniref:Uncharacterized protein n=1 Tax=Cylicostephanus goldi TaxID=71465 RepID=A0A3P6SGV9_CYLGO|nr:unnamed protein product [Cylicostephanus goldi]